MEDTTRIYRRATLADKEGVLSITPDLYGGRDYLPACYDSTIKNHRGYVCEDKGQIIAFAMITIVDGGETAIRRGGRVLERYRGQGVFRHLSDYMTSDLSTLPLVKYSAMTMREINQASAYLERENYIAKLKIKCMVVNYNINDVCIERASDDFTVCEVDQQHMAAILNSKSARDYLFPEGYVRIHCQPYKPSTFNMDFFISDSTYVVASFHKNDSNRDNIRLLTLGSYFPCKVGLAYQIDIFGDKADDLHEHFCSHFEKIGTLTKGTVSSGIMFGENLEFEQIQAVLSRYGFPRGNEFVLATYIKAL